MTSFPHQVDQRVYRPEDDEFYGKKGGLTQPARTVPPVSTLEYVQAHCRLLPDFQKVVGWLRRRKVNRHDA